MKEHAIRVLPCEHTPGDNVVIDLRSGISRTRHYDPALRSGKYRHNANNASSSFRAVATGPRLRRDERSN